MERGSDLIPANIIEDLKFRNRIEDVIGTYVTLSRAGSNMKGLCPFHSEKTPSFTVYTGNGSFYCFGCGAGGDVVSFIMRAENLDYRSALQYLADKSGVTLPDDDAPVQKGPSRQRILEMNKCAARFFRDMLFDPVQGEKGRSYLMGERGLSSAVIKHFGLGYAPDSFNALRDHLRKNGYTREEMVEGYLCQVSKKDERYTYDCFRNRVMFPIIDVSGNVIAFGGRVLDDSKPKYLNSADTPAFKKSRNLFALNYARNHAEKNLILCEGYMDVIALHAAGFENAVATLGTAITPDQARIMKRYTDKVIISYDGDEAGRKAADKAMRLLSDAGVDAKVLKMEGAKDPDEFIKRYGATHFEKLLTGSRSRFDYKIDGVKEKYDLTDVDQKIRAAEELCREIAGTYSKIEREIYIGKVARELEISEESVRHDVERAERRIAAKKKQEKKNELFRETSAIGDRINPDSAKYPGISRLEDSVIGLILMRQEFVPKAMELLTEEDFMTDLNKRFFAFICEAHRNGGFEFGQLSERFTQDEVSRAVKCRSDRENLKLCNDTVLEDFCRNLKKETKACKEKESGNLSLSDIIARRRNEN